MVLQSNVSGCAYMEWPNTNTWQRKIRPDDKDTINGSKSVRTELFTLHNFKLTFSPLFPLSTTEYVGMSSAGLDALFCLAFFPFFSGTVYTSPVFDAGSLLIASGAYD